ncbi:MAG: hypothetical protein JW839_13800 [Candidatus Lokiarchaeota archaeon]|nr:hypothetical protein [Candidatus Lokiarchaeota archaeon]
MCGVIMRICFHVYDWITEIFVSGQGIIEQATGTCRFCGDKKITRRSREAVPCKQADGNT